MEQEKSLQESHELGTQRHEHENGISRLLHTIAAHLHRYSSELAHLEDVLSGMSTQCKDFNTNPNKANEVDLDKTLKNLRQLTSHLRQAKGFVAEMDRKAQNILALVCEDLSAKVLANHDQLFHRIQLANDRSLVLNAQKMHAILIATQDEAKTSKEIARQSHAIAEEMKQDSVAMKTVLSPHRNDLQISGA